MLPPCNTETHTRTPLRGTATIVLRDTSAVLGSRADFGSCYAELNCSVQRTHSQNKRSSLSKYSMFLTAYDCRGDTRGTAPGFICGYGYRGGYTYRIVAICCGIVVAVGLFSPRTDSGKPLRSSTPSKVRNTPSPSSRPPTMKEQPRCRISASAATISTC